MRAMHPPMEGVILSSVHTTKQYEFTCSCGEHHVIHLPSCNCKICSMDFIEGHVFDHVDEARAFLELEDEGGG